MLLCWKPRVDPINYFHTSSVNWKSPKITQISPIIHLTLDCFLRICLSLLYRVNKIKTKVFRFRSFILLLLKHRLSDNFVFLFPSLFRRSNFSCHLEPFRETKLFVYIFNVASDTWAYFSMAIFLRDQENREGKHNV